MVRLNKYLANCGVAARRKCDELILAGEISVNGVVERRLGLKIDEETDKIRFRKRLVRPVNKPEYIVMNKPKGIVTTASDEKGRKTVLDLVQVGERVFPVGRLDRDTSGLLLMTNDGDLAYRTTHPKFEIPKKYEVRLNRELQEQALKAIEAGVSLEEGVTAPCAIRFTDTLDRTKMEITLHQGWKRQIRRMFAAAGYTVKKLHRTQVGGIRLRGLRIGEWRRLKKHEVQELRRITGGNQR